MSNYKHKAAIKFKNLPLRRDELVDAVLLPNRLVVPPVLPKRLDVELGVVAGVLPNVNVILFGQ